MHKKLLEIPDWEFAGLLSSHKVHQLHPYFAKYHSELPRRVINEMTKENDIVLDPFCGSGTTLVEASLAGRNSIGIDMNPIACLMSRVKTSIISASSFDALENIIKNIELDIDLYYQDNSSRNVFQNQYELPNFHNRDFWFTADALNELAIIKAHIVNNDVNPLKDFLFLSFSRIIVYSSNQHGESRYTRVEKNRKAKDVFYQFKKVLLNTKEIITGYSSVRKDVYARVLNMDSKNMELLHDNSVDLVVTSPPYLNSWDYGLYHRFRFFWLDMDVKAYEKKEIGKHLRTLEGRSKTDEIERYRNDMGAVLKEVARTLKKNKFCFIVNANSIVKKKFIDTNQILVEEAAKHGLILEDIMERTILGPHHGMHASLKSKNIIVEDENFVSVGKTSKQEQILIFQNK